MRMTQYYRLRGPGLFLAAALSCSGLMTDAAVAATTADVREVGSTAAEREAVAVTVYNADLALVKELRRVNLPDGMVRLTWRDVAAQMRPETALLRATNGPAINLVEQNFDFDLLTPQKLLEKYIGREVAVIRSHPSTGEERREKATVLAAGSGTVLRFADRIETGVPGRLAFDSVPPNLRDRPTLSVVLETPGGKRPLELSYLTGGLSWQADYVANLSTDGTRLDLDAWVTLTNRSGTSFDQATLQLVAGTVNRVAAPRPEMAADVMGMTARAKVRGPVEESLMDYHLYSFERPTTIADNQTKQLALLSASAVPVRHQYLLAGNAGYYAGRIDQGVQKLKPAVFIEFDNKGGQLGKPLPAGVVRVYARDSHGAAQFVGEDRIEHTAKNETLRLHLGEAFDITAERKQTSFRRIADNVTESAWHIELRNAREEAVVVRIEEPMPGDWEMLRESHPHAKDTARLASWNVAVPAGGKAVLDYSVRVRW
jgi:hypothetical protein